MERGGFWWFILIAVTTSGEGILFAGKYLDQVKDTWWRTVEIIGFALRINCFTILIAFLINF